MLCFVQGFGEAEHAYNKNREINGNVSDSNLKYTKERKRVSLQTNYKDTEEDQALAQSRKSRALVTGKSLRLSSGNRFTEVKRSFSDRFSVITDASSKRPPRTLLTIRKTW
ncbi:unnamed protein product [Arctia plantaginis]|uniref:Uncharacterized protein n=1 Tax=Arctia plantaginis TaxID=874455 RepID=A0A8S1AIU6_ARCPL|nr:unnamed protein product [Arctia plantaginis]CAB3260659.1 unnamed protein product [Arctia plantaginis]